MFNLLSLCDIRLLFSASLVTRLNCVRELDCKPWRDQTRAPGVRDITVSLSHSSFSRYETALVMLVIAFVAKIQKWQFHSYVKIFKGSIFSDVTPWGLVEIHWSFEVTYVKYYQTIQLNILQEGTLHNHCCEESHISDSIISLIKCISNLILSIK
jgi:hypothetical protein